MGSWTEEKVAVALISFSFTFCPSHLPHFHFPVPCLALVCYSFSSFLLRHAVCWPTRPHHSTQCASAHFHTAPHNVLWTCSRCVTQSACPQVHTRPQQATPGHHVYCAFPVSLLPPFPLLPPIAPGTGHSPLCVLRDCSAVLLVHKGWRSHSCCQQELLSASCHSRWQPWPTVSLLGSPVPKIWQECVAAVGTPFPAPLLQFLVSRK